MNLMLRVMTLQRQRIWKFRWRGNNWKERHTRKGKKVWQCGIPDLWQEEGHILTHEDPEAVVEWGEKRTGIKKGKLDLEEMGAFPADGFYPLMTFESITCWKWPRRKYDEEVSVIRDERGKRRNYIRQRVMCVCPLFLDSTLVFWPCWTSKHYHDLLQAVGRVTPFWM